MTDPLEKCAPDTSGHEKRDARFRPIALAFGVLFILMALSYAISGLVLHLDSRQTSRSPATTRGDGRALSEPRLQTDPAQDLERLRQAENDALNNYGWVDRSRGIVRVPIDRAMELLLKRGLPTRMNPPETQP
jgi:hypothetical protein